MRCIILRYINFLFCSILYRTKILPVFLFNGSIFYCRIGDCDPQGCLGSTCPRSRQTLPFLWYFPTTTTRWLQLAQRCLPLLDKNRSKRTIRSYTKKKKNERFETGIDGWDDDDNDDDDDADDDDVTISQCCCPRGKSLSSRILEDQLSSPCACPRTTSPCPCPHPPK